MRGLRQRTRALPALLCVFFFVLLLFFFHFPVVRVPASHRAPRRRSSRALRCEASAVFTSLPLLLPTASTTPATVTRSLSLPLCLCASPIHPQHDSPHPAVLTPLTHDGGHGGKNLSIWRNLKKDDKKKERERAAVAAACRCGDQRTSSNHSKTRTTVSWIWQERARTRPELGGVEPLLKGKEGGEEGGS